MRVKLQFLSTVVCLAGILLGVACKLWFPQLWFDLYPLILVVFWAVEMIMSFIIGHYEGQMDSTTFSGSHWLKAYMMSKLIKVFIALALILVSLLTIDSKDVKIEFAVCAVLFYFLNLGVETYVVTQRSSALQVKK